MRTLLSSATIALASLVMTSGTVLASAPAHASLGTAATPRVIVHTDDLDLTSAGGRSTAERRIRNAAAEVCPDERIPLGAAGRCRTDAIRAADAALQTRIAAR